MKKLIPFLILSSILLTSCRNTASKDNNTSINSGTTTNSVRDNNSANSNSGEIVTSSGKKDVVVDKISTGSKNLGPNELTDKKNTIQKDNKNSSTGTTTSGSNQTITGTTAEEDETLKEIDKIMNEAMNEK